VVAVDTGLAVLGRARARTQGLVAAVADGAVLPVRDATFDLLCFAQAWHWIDESTRVSEAHRVLRNDGRWAAWWSHARADAEDWFDAYWSAIEHVCPGTHRGKRDVDWGEAVASSGLFTLDDRVVVRWMREVSVDDWMTDQASHSYVAGLPAVERDQLLTHLRNILTQPFPDGAVNVQYETWLWTGTKNRNS
jgi:SAM-dependent methyltransferase